LLDLL